MTDIIVYFTLSVVVFLLFKSLKAWNEEKQERELKQNLEDREIEAQLKERSERREIEILKNKIRKQKRS